VVIGSYPFEADDGFAAQIVLRSRDDQALATALEEVRKLAQSLMIEGKARGFS
jgi:hypothetical protein